MPPTSFPTGLQPITTNAKDRRISRTDMDFEQALRAEGTVKLAEGVDVNSLGVDTSPLPTPRDFSSPTPPAKQTRTPRHHHTQPATPVIVPPTPSPNAGPSSARMAPASPSSSTGDVFYDAEDSDVQTKRRSMYRSPGTSSSPDLATLLRKAKERGVAPSTHPNQKTQRSEPPPPLPDVGLRAPDRPASGNRARSSTSSATFQTPTSSPSIQSIRSNGNGNMRHPDSASNEDWVLTSTRSRGPSRDPREAGDSKVREIYYLFTYLLTIPFSLKSQYGLRRVPFWAKCGGKEQFATDL